MMKTRRLFYENVYQKDFEAEVLFCGEDEAGTYVILDQTVFYPEGGGQPADRGVLCPEHDGGVHETCENRPESAAGAAATSEAGSGEQEAAPAEEPAAARQEAPSESSPEGPAEPAE